MTAESAAAVEPVARTRTFATAVRRLAAIVGGAVLIPLVPLGISCVVMLWSGGGAALRGASAGIGHVALHVAVGAGGSFFLHEALHLASLVACPSVEGARVRGSVLRISVEPVGAMTTGEVLRTAAVGPLGTTLAGALMLGVPWARELAPWFLAHALFALPPFGDGRAIFDVLAGRRRATRWLHRGTRFRRGPVRG